MRLGVILLLLLCSCSAWEDRSFNAECYATGELFTCIVPDRTKFEWDQAKWDTGIGAYAYTNNGQFYIWVIGYRDTNGRLHVDKDDPRDLGHELLEVLAMKYPGQWAIPHKDKS